jgi:short-subunit dehydrogenase involved in D-alanine esterification of teichoic acids
MNPTGNTILIAGGTSGIGLALGRRLHAGGNRIIVSGRRQDLLNTIASENPGIETVALDVTYRDAVRDIAAAFPQRYPRLNVLITMAGIMQPENLHSNRFLDTAETTVATNLLGPIRLVGALTAHLATQPDAHIITVSSGLAFVPLPATPTYNATKAAIHSFTESLRVQLADTTIRVRELVPPAVRTSLMNQENAERAMPLEAFIDEAMDQLHTPEQPYEILVDAVKPLRYAERDGRYPDMLHMLSRH